MVQLTGILIFILILAIYGYVYKIPMMCYGCETPDAFTAMFFKCIVDTSADSEMCIISQRIDKLPQDIKNSGEKITGVIVQELGTKLPDTIKIAYDNVMMEIENIIKIISDNIDNFRGKLSEFIKEAYEKSKKMVIKTYEEFYALLILPIIEYIEKNISGPILEAVKILLQFKKLISDSISQAYESITGEIIKLKNTLVNSIGLIPKYIQEFINALIDAINFATDKSVDAGNEAISKVVGFTNGGIQKLADVANLATDSVVGISKKAVIGIEENVNKTIGFINENAVDKINILIDPGVDILSKKLTELLVKPLNEATGGLSKITGNVVNPIIDASNDVGKVINAVIDFKIPSITLPQIDIPEADLKIAKIPAWTLLKETKLTEDIKILKDAKKLGIISKPNLEIGKVGDIKLDVPEKLKRVGSIKIPLDYGIPKIGPPAENPPGVYIKVKKDLIPKPDNINGGTPRSGVKNIFNMEKGGFLPQIDLDPAMQSIKNELNKPIDFFNDKIQKIYDETMKPINDVIAVLVGAYESIKSAIRLLFEKYINIEFITKVKEELIRTSGIIVERALVIINETVITPILSIIYKIKDSIMASINKVIDVVSAMFSAVGKVLGDMFEVVSQVLYEATQVLMKGGYYFILFSLAKWVDMTIPLDIPIGAKLNLVFITLATIVFTFLYRYAVDLMSIIPFVLVLITMFIAPIYINKTVTPKQITYS